MLENDPNVKPGLAVDLSQVKAKAWDRESDKKAQAEANERALELSQKAADDRARMVLLHQAAGKARNMNRAFKGIRGSLGRRGYALRALREYDLV